MIKLFNFIKILPFVFASSVGASFNDDVSASNIPKVQRYIFLPSQLDNFSISYKNLTFSSVNYRLFEIEFTVYDDFDFFARIDETFEYKHWFFGLSQLDYFLNTNGQYCGVSLYNSNLYFSFDDLYLPYHQGRIPLNNVFYYPTVFTDAVSLNGFEDFKVSLLVDYYVDANDVLANFCITNYFEPFSHTEYNEGYGYGFYDGYESGFQDGFDDGVIVGYDDGYDDGFISGYDDGLDFNASGGMFGWITSLFRSMSDIFNVSLFGDFTIGTLALIMITFTLVPFILGMFKGKS